MKRKISLHNFQRWALGYVPLAAVIIILGDMGLLLASLISRKNRDAG